MSRKILCIITFLLTIPFSMAYSWSASGSFDCDGCCVEKKQFTYKSTITNTGEGQLFINAGKLIDYSDSKFATYGDVDNYGWPLDPEEEITFTYTGQLPDPTSGSTLYYKHCLYIGGYWTGSWSCPPNYATETVAGKSDFKCYTDANCPTDEFCYIRSDCIASDCIPVKQGDCGYISNHKWVDYECCDDNDCPSSEACVENHCVSIACECGYISGHQCIHYECCDDNACKSTEQCINHACQEPSCGYCEYVVNHRCTRHECCEDSECAKDERCINHRCQKLTCKYGEYVSEHRCLAYECMSDEDCPLDKQCRDHNCLRPQCSSDEIIKHHTCKRLAFTPFGYIKDNTYVSYFSKEGYEDYKRSYVAVFILTPIAVVAVAYFFRKRKVGVFGLKEFTEQKPKREEKETVNLRREILVKCAYCGKSIKPADEYCMFCGKKMETRKKGVEETFKKPKEETKKAKAKYCNKCGSKLTGTMNFCNKCGAKILRK